MRDIRQITFGEAVGLDTNQLESIHHFGHSITKVISGGSKDAGVAWAGYGMTYALNSDMVLNSVMAVSNADLNRLRRLPVNHEHNACVAMP